MQRMRLRTLFAQAKCHKRRLLDYAGPNAARNSSSSASISPVAAALAFDELPVRTRPGFTSILYVEATCHFDKNDLRSILYTMPKKIFKADPLGVVTSHRHPGFALGCFFRCLAPWPEGLSCANLLAAASWATGCNIALDRGADPIKWCFTKAAARSAFQQVGCSQNSNARITGQEAW